MPQINRPGDPCKWPQGFINRATFKSNISSGILNTANPCGLVTVGYKLSVQLVGNWSVLGAIESKNSRWMAEERYQRLAEEYAKVRAATQRYFLLLNAHHD